MLSGMHLEIIPPQKRFITTWGPAFEAVGSIAAWIHILQGDALRTKGGVLLSGEVWRAMGFLQQRASRSAAG